MPRRREFEQGYRENKLAMYVRLAQLCELIVFNNFTPEACDDSIPADTPPFDVRSAAATMPIGWMCREESSKWLLARVRRRL